MIQQRFYTHPGPAPSTLAGGKFPGDPARNTKPKYQTKVLDANFVSYKSPRCSLPNLKLRLHTDVSPSRLKLNTLFNAPSTCNVTHILYQSRPGGGAVTTKGDARTVIRASREPKDRNVVMSTSIYEVQIAITNDFQCVVNAKANLGFYYPKHPFMSINEYVLRSHPFSKAI